jgi:hypothetical protein
MRNVLYKTCTENQNTHFMFNKVFPKIVLFIIPKNVVETEEPKIMSQYGAYTLHAKLTRLHALMHVHTPTCTRVLTCMHAHEHTHNNK